MSKAENNGSFVGSALVSIDNQRRVDVSREPISAALGLKINTPETTYIWGLSGAQRQLQLLPPESDLAQLRDRLDIEPRRKTVGWDASEDTDVETYRKLKGFFKIACHARKGGKTLRLTLPRDLIDLGYFRAGEALIIFWTGELVELWPQDRWREAIANRDLRELVRRARRAL